MAAHSIQTQRKQCQLSEIDYLNGGGLVFQIPSVAESFILEISSAGAVHSKKRLCSSHFWNRGKHLLSCKCNAKKTGRLNRAHRCKETSS